MGSAPGGFASARRATFRRRSASLDVLVRPPRPPARHGRVARFARPGRAVDNGRVDDPAPPDATRLLQRLKQGDREAAAELMPLVYGELHKLAAAQMARQPAEHTLQATALVHEAYLRLVGHEQARWQNRGEFYGMASKVMRNVLVDHARSKQAAKRGGRSARLALEDVDAVAEGTGPPDVDLLALDEALTALSRTDPGLARLVELRFFGGLSTEETAHVLETSPRTVERRFRVARMWLADHLEGDAPGPDSP